jgi:Rad52/22 family double-strand break repair protein
VIEWRVINTAKDGNPLRGQVIPYADPRAYTDRLNALFTPAGWTRRYQVHTSARFERGGDKQVVAKVVVACELTIFGLGAHSATGEEFSDDPNAATSAEAQSFKRAAACFGLGRYLYHFRGQWVDLDGKKRPKKIPMLFGWATPEGWHRGLRPGNPSTAGSTAAPSKESGESRGLSDVSSSGSPLVQKIERMQAEIGTHLYRGLLRSAKVWKPSQIRNDAQQRQTLERMQAAERGLQRLNQAMENLGQAKITAILNSLKIRSIDRISDLQTLHALVVKMEAAK